MLLDATETGTLHSVGGSPVGMLNTLLKIERDLNIFFVLSWFPFNAGTFSKTSHVSQFNYPYHMPSICALCVANCC
jgi:hypothetical protein